MILDKFSLAGRSGILTGAGSGIGKAIARGLSEAGPDVVIAGRNLAKLEKYSQRILLHRQSADAGNRCYEISGKHPIIGRSNSF